MCLGNLVAEKAAACADPRVHIHPAGQAGARVPWVLNPAADGTYTIHSSGRAEGCATYLTARFSCANAALALAPADGSALQRWRLVPVDSPSPPASSPPPPLAGQAPSLTVTNTRATTAYVTVAPPPGGCTPLSYEVASAPAFSLAPPTVVTLSAGQAITARLGNLVAVTAYSATVVGVCADGTRTPRSAPVKFTTLAGPTV